VFHDLDHVITEQPVGRYGLETGIVAVKFNCSESGAPANVTLYKTSGSRILDVTTVRAVQRIATLHPLPARIEPGQTFIVRVLFADSEESARQQIADMQAAAAKNNAWYGNAPSALAYLEIAPGR
jgi:TonB family protein